MHFSEQERLAHNYIQEACAITRHQTSAISNFTCAIAPSVAKLNVPVLPCNFLPIAPQLLSRK